MRILGTRYGSVGLMTVAVAMLSFGSFAGDEIRGDVYSLDVCPVSGEKLGAMGDPIRINYEGRDIRFCCGSCPKLFKADPTKFIAKIDALTIEQQKEHYALKTCPVTGNELGSMGDPIDKIYNNRLVRFCCSGCDKTFMAEPAKFIAKLDSAVIAKQKADYPFDVCLVSGEKLQGSHGKLITKVIGNRLVKFCCAACVTRFENDPAKYIAMLDARKLDMSVVGEGSDHK